VTTATTTAAGARTSSTTNVSLDGMGASGVSQWDVVENRSGPAAPDTSRSLRALSDGGPFDVRVEGVESGHLWNLSITDNQQPGLVRGRTYVDDLNPSTPGVTLTYARDGQGCEASSASVRVDDVAYEGPGKDLVRLDAQVSLACRSAQPYTVSLRVRERAGADVVPPPAVVGLRGSRVGDRVQVSWGRPAEAALGGYVVRWFAGTRAPLTPTNGTFGYGGTATSASFSAPARTPVALCVWAYDAAGNLGPRATLYLAPVG
jgi:hypothetical protein